MERIDLSRDRFHRTQAYSACADRRGTASPIRAVARFD